MARMHISWIKSGIGYAEDQKRTLKALGLHRLNQRVTHNDCTAIRGMINKVKHLVKVEVEVSEAE
ncbi:50S ribosomal protein L30 [Desulfobacteraceae bacterium SEEP-SAG9]|nr:50S ribosomal protein L30 [Desulfobacteraceae bacterium SEEP-SAG9]